MSRAGGELCRATNACRDRAELAWGRADRARAGAGHRLLPQREPHPLQVAARLRLQRVDLPAGGRLVPHLASVESPLTKEWPAGCGLGAPGCVGEVAPLLSAQTSSRCARTASGRADSKKGQNHGRAAADLELVLCVHAADDEAMVYNEGRAAGHTEGRTALRGAREEQRAAAGRRRCACAASEKSLAAPEPRQSGHRKSATRRSARRARRSARRRTRRSASARGGGGRPRAKGPPRRAVRRAVVVGRRRRCCRAASTRASYIGGLPFWYTEEKLREDFGALGEIVKTHPMRSLTRASSAIALVTFAEPSAATAARVERGAVRGRLRCRRPDSNKRS